VYPSGVGLDAPSQDLTARIQARRRSLILSGEIEPALPGERMIHGKQPGAAATFETAGAALATAQTRRAFRSARAEEVVEMDYTDYSEGADADEPFEVGAGEPEPEPEPEPEDDELLRAAEELEIDLRPSQEEYAERVLLDDDGLLLALAEVKEMVTVVREEMHERMDAYDRGLIALARGLGEELQALRPTINFVGDALTPAEDRPINFEKPVPEKKRGWFFPLKTRDFG